jgi:hypothetical protein
MLVDATFDISAIVVVVGSACHLRRIVLLNVALSLKLPLREPSWCVALVDGSSDVRTCR